MAKKILAQAQTRVCCPGIVELDQYLRFRAALEGVAYDLTPEFLQGPFDCGVRMFFGVRVTERGLVCDQKNPAEFVAWRARRL